MKRRFVQKKNILLVNITRLGDMLQATPTIAGMKMENPEARITVLVEKQFSEVCRYIPNIDEVVSIDLGMVVRSLTREGDGIVDAFEYVTSVVEDLRSRNFDFCLNMSSSAYTALLLNLIGIERNGGWTSDAEGFRRIESAWAQLFATSVFHQNRQYNSLNLVDVFRRSADVHEHPRKLLITVEREAKEFAASFIAEAGFTNRGPLIAIQAGASQAKRQWAPPKFVELVKLLTAELGARVILTGTKKELEIIEPIAEAAGSKNVVVAAGKTSIPELAALLEAADLLVTGDTGPMHMSVAVGTPVIAMFLASAYGFETGPYSEGNIVLQPVIGCGPCNPNKPCSRPDCHDAVTPELILELARMRLEGDFTEIPDRLAEPGSLIIYRSHFDEFGFSDLHYMHPSYRDPCKQYRDAYRKLWLDELGGFPVAPGAPRPRLSLASDAAPGIEEAIRASEEGRRLIRELLRLVDDAHASPAALGQVNDAFTELDRLIEQIGYQNAPLGPLTRMFIFAKENISGTEVRELASQMERAYSDLGRRAGKFAAYAGLAPSVAYERDDYGFRQDKRP